MNKDIWKVVPLDEMSPRDMEFARSKGIIKDPDFCRNKEQENNNSATKEQSDAGWLDLGSADVMPAGDIKSGFRRTVETKTGIVRDLG